MEEQAVNPRLSVVVCTWNRSDLLAECLESLAAQEVSSAGGAPPFEILVVDDGPHGSTARVVEKAGRVARHPVRYLPQEHAGLSAARNLGAREAAAPIVLFFDDDQLAPPGHFARLLRRLESEPSLDGIGGPYLDYGGGPRTCGRCSLASVDLPGEGYRPVHRLLGGNMALRSVLFESVGPFDRDISGRGDEAEWFWRARGKQFSLDPELWIWHRRDRTSLPDLMSSAIRQGRATPLALAKSGRKSRPRPLRLVRAIGHALYRRCSMGLIVASRELGWLLAWPAVAARTARPGSASRPSGPS
jgi:glycosyltransferase involved in cell wall biosynthesis